MPDQPAMKAIKAVGPSVRNIQKQVGVKPAEKKKKRGRGFFEEVGENLSGLKYLPDYLLNNPRPRR